ncbi:MAG: hypothetical protein GC205_12540 [Bacteroidetes bacterium]|nr:hypothetical protein [Bacteroidota bacterium]
MGKRTVLVGQGDDQVEDWSHGFQPIDETLNEFITEADEFGFDVQWGDLVKVAFEVEEVHPNFYVGSSLSIYEYLNEMCVLQDFWDGGAPGMSGTYITVRVEKGKIRYVKNRLKKLIDLLKETWRQNGWLAIRLEAKCILLEEEVNNLSSEVSSLQRKLGEKDKILNEYLESDKGRKDLMNIFFTIVSFLIHPTGMFLQHGPFLITRDKNILVITNNQQMSTRVIYPEVLKLLKFSTLNIVEVHEYSLDGTRLSHIAYFAMASVDFRRGWAQKSTLLRCVDSIDCDPNAIRQEYLDWLKR